MIRKATKEDIDAIVAIYEAILDNEEAGKCRIGWIRGIYPTRETAEEALKKGTLFVSEKAGKIVAAAKIDQSQMPQYAECKWEYDVPDDKVMVLHTLVVDPACFGHGYGPEFVYFYEKYAFENDCLYLRLDTNETNTVAWNMYKKMGYHKTGIVIDEFNGIPNVHLVCLEKKIND